VKSLRTPALRATALAVAIFISFSTSSQAQNTPATTGPDSSGAVQDLQDQVRQLRSMVEEMRAENAQSRAEMQRLRQDLQATRALLERPGAPTESGAAPAEDAPPPVVASATVPSASSSVSEPSSTSTTPTAASQTSSSLEDRVQKLEEAASLIGSKIDEQYQTKVETASKYRARLHGIVLMNAFRNVGGSNNFDLPDYAEPISQFSPVASVGATLRQSEIGFEIFGPTLAGARTSADVQLDFSGGFSNTGNSVNFGIVRLQTASLRMDWENTSVVAGQDSLFISPLSPTSFASLATPAFALAGNLWGWTPQIRVEHRFALSDQQTLTVQAGVLDNLDWEYQGNQFLREPQAGELSGQPAYAVRTAWSRPLREHPLSFGVAGYYGRQNWTWDRYVDAWAAMADWQIPILPRLSLSGEFYRGRGIGGLGAAVGRAIVYGGNPFRGSTPIRPVDAAGGWTQLKLQITPKVELNGVVAEDDTFPGNIRGFATDDNNFSSILGRNRGAFGNVVFRPRSDLIFSAELRRLRSFPIYSSSIFTNQVNLSMGILF
jgi:hypothetical protein